MLRVPRCGDMTVWAAVGGTVLSVVAQIVAMKTLGEGVGRSTRNNIWKDTSGGTENMLARGECDIIGLDECSGVCVNSIRRNSGFDRHGSFRYFREGRRGNPGMKFSDGGIHRRGRRRDHQRGRVWTRVK